MKLGSHVGMSGKEMLLGSAKEAVSYGANTFMFYTGAPQNTRRKEISELNISPAWEYMKEHGIDEIIVHAPYIINLGNSVKPETFELAVEFLAKEIERTAAFAIYRTHFGKCIPLCGGSKRRGGFSGIDFEKMDVCD